MKLRTPQPLRESVYAYRRNFGDPNSRLIARELGLPFTNLSFWIPVKYLPLSFWQPSLALAKLDLRKQ